MNHRTDRTINGIIGAAENLAVKLPAARSILLEQRNRIDGWPGGGERIGSRSTGGLTPTESAASQREAIEARLRSWNDELNAVVLILNNLRIDLDRAIGARAEVDRCTATGREGAIEWHDADCWDAPIRGPLCAKHYQKERRWRISHGLPTRDTEAA